MPFPVIGDCRVFPPWRSSIERLQGLDLSITASGLFSTESPSNLSHGEYKTNNKRKNAAQQILENDNKLGKNILIVLFYCIRVFSKNLGIDGYKRVFVKCVKRKQANTHVLGDVLHVLTKVFAHHHQPHQATTLQFVRLAAIRHQIIIKLIRFIYRHI